MTALGALAIGLAGALGALARFGADALISASWRGRYPSGSRGQWPWATLLVNLIGSFGIGLSAGLLLQAVLDPFWYQVLATGLAGGLTTFSSFTVATVLLWQQGRRLPAAANLIVNTVLGLSAAAAGLALGGI
ncbi:CrcB family protein [Acaricomes phytoseiuli]|uniref:fluoride efflux transporter FluC n=1 Tax=Acaricomes phytoseiuli TaxID=291968 RepID=UPI00035FE3B3|nr:CrcB family protein [Acaricomes phytoseiuli]MCW1249390.1 CrcB family protein [Acaricomes phytoseiuli]